MNRRILVAVLFSFILFSGTARGAGDVLGEFLKAYDTNNPRAMTAVVERNKETVPWVVKGLIAESRKPDITAEEREEKQYIAELMAREYRDITGDAALLLDVKRAVFESLLHPAVRSEAAGGVHVVEIPAGSEKVMNVFRPDSIIIKAGETVRWVNRDRKAHVFASMPLIGEGGIFSPSIKPGESWEFKFEKPGDYYYLCFIHKGMVGKVTVLPAAEKAEAAKASKEGQ